ncbi:alpha/beta hydrolase [Hoeflea sp. WL0058]|uniref:Alpha/beta hydrolase n=1 Tax=Flavimaribacter sediminis TaxID=2865987 RepID=A0AAE2ZPX5_9HYPH|nr:alpha/beta hydrolase [Flavimaribacter sediminis]MBW8639854.1 alpha/beta hydrolase [Flavimaribacter sediminis]
MFDPVILIHGAWQGSWAWRDLIGLLQARGLACHAVDLPGNGTDATPPESVTLELYARHVEDFIDGLDRPVSLVAHSGGGNVATAVAEARPDRVARIVYLAGMMLPSGMSFGDLLAQEYARDRGLIGIGDHLLWSSDGLMSSVPADAAIEIFYHDAEPAAARKAADKLTPQPESGRAVAANWTEERYGTAPRLYVECSMDRSIDVSLQRRMQELVPGAKVRTLETGHAPQLSAPDKLADTIWPFLADQQPNADQ